MTDRAGAERLDEADPLAGYRDHFVIPDPDLVYMDGNSLGRPTARALAAVAGMARDEWAEGLVGSWEQWIDEPAAVGDLLAAHLVGAEPGEVILTDQTSVNLYKLATAALAASPGRTVIVTDRANFPSDRYVLAAVAAAFGGAVRSIDADPVAGPQLADVAAALDATVALVSLSHVAYRSGAIANMTAITAAAQEAGALALWDLSHSVGVVPVELGAAGADLAVGCTYKYLGGGPGSPAFLFVRRDLQTTLTQPIQGWWGHADMFGFAPDYLPAPDVRRFTTGTPPMLAMAAAGAAIRTVAEAGIGPIRAKSELLTELAVDLHDAWLEPLGFSLGTPRDPAPRGGHVAVRHPDGNAMCRALVARHRVVPDFRAPDTIRFGAAPLYTRFVDVWDALDRLRRIAETSDYGEDAARRVT